MPRRRAPRREREERQDEEVLGEEQGRAEQARDRGRDAEVPPPQARGAGEPQVPAVARGRDALELGSRVAHVEHLVGEDPAEDLARALVRDDVPVDLEARGGDLLGEVEEGQERSVPLVLHPQVVAPALAGGEPARLERRGSPGPERGQQRPTARPEQLGVVALVHGVPQEQPPEERVRGELRRPRQVAPAVRLGGGERHQLARAAVRVPPDPPVHRTEGPLQRGRAAVLHGD